MKKCFLPHQQKQSSNKPALLAALPNNQNEPPLHSAVCLHWQLMIVLVKMENHPEMLCKQCFFQMLGAPVWFCCNWQTNPGKPGQLHIPGGTQHIWASSNHLLEMLHKAKLKSRMHQFGRAEDGSLCALQPLAICLHTGAAGCHCSCAGEIVCVFRHVRWTTAS